MVNVITYIVICCIVFHECVAQPSKPIVSSNDKVDEKDLRCASCLAIVDVVNKEMEKKSFDTIESRLYTILEDICDTKHYRMYDYIPPKMVEGCREFFDDHDEEELVKVFTQHYNTPSALLKELEVKVCKKLSRACIGNKRLTTATAAVNTEKEDKEFAGNLEDLKKKHGSKVKAPTPVKAKDEL